MSAALQRRVVEILALLFEIMLIATEEVHRGRVRLFFRSVFQRDSKIPAAKARLEALVRGEEGFVLAETLASIKRALSLQHHMAEDLEALKTETREQRALTNRQRLRDLLEPSPTAKTQFDYLETHRTKGTGEWIVKDGTFLDWIEHKFQFLWVRGNPGTGKSYLASRIIHWINDRLVGVDQGSNSAAYFFFQEATPETRSVLQALRDIAYQLSEDDAFYAKEILRLLGSKDDLKTVRSAFDIALDRPCTTDTRQRCIYIVLDGIDEAEREQVEELLELFNKLSNPAHTRSVLIQIALVSRVDLVEAVETRLDPEVQKDQLKIIHVTPVQVRNDVRAFIMDQIKRSYSLKRVDPLFKTQVGELLVEKVDGLFILATLMLQDVNRKTHRKAILDSLASYPKDFDGMMTETLRRLADSLQPEQINDLNEVLTWVTCAEQPLTLQQVEAVLVLKWGELSFDVEEALRTVYSCFFSLARDDGMTTADLYQRSDRRRNLSPASGGKDSSAGSPRPTSPATRVGGNTRNGRKDDRNDSPDPFNPLPGADFHSNEKTTTVTFQHASITTFFRGAKSTNVGATATGPGIGFDLQEGRLHVLKQCLAILTTLPETESNPLWKYATWYWQEHLVAVDQGRVSAKDKRDIGRSLYMLITQRKNILDWTKEEETLKLFTDVSIDSLQKWMADPDVLSGLDDVGRAWAVGAAKTTGGLVECIGRLYAQAWLDPDFGQYVMTMTCFEIVHSVAYVHAGHSFAESDNQWEALPAQTRLRTALGWANIPKTAHSLRRIGSTYVNMGLYSEGLKNFNEALPLDGDLVETVGRIAFCYMQMQNYEQALIRNLMCEAIEEGYISSRHFTTEKAQEFSRWRLYTNQLQIAKCYRKLGKIDKAILYFEKAIAHSHDKDRFEPESECLSFLAANNLHREIMALLESMGGRHGKDGNGPGRLVDFLVDQASNAVSLEWIIPKTASIMSRTAFMEQQYMEAIQVAAGLQDAAKHLYLQLSLANLHYYSRNYEAAIAIHYEISQTASERGSVLVRVLNTMSLRSWATVCKAMIVRAGIQSADADSLIAKLEELRDQQRQQRNKDMPQRLVGMDVNDASLYLGLFQKQRDRVEQARELLIPIIFESLDILDDNEPQNDAHAIDNLSRALVAMGDLENALGLFQSVRRPADEFVQATTADSAVDTAHYEPLLPYVLAQPWVCLQCLNTLMIDQDVVVCTRCLDTYCAGCLESVIKVADNTTAHRRTDVVCRSDHEWFSVPPLRMKLGRGELLMPDGKVKLAEWQLGLREKWAIR
jgi:tetratricopeptide (TPR) repeat protein